MLIVDVVHPYLVVYIVSQRCDSISTVAAPPIDSHVTLLDWHLESDRLLTGLVDGVS